MKFDAGQEVSRYSAPPVTGVDRVEAPEPLAEKPLELWSVLTAWMPKLPVRGRPKGMSMLALT
jgi:hypothetical protein